MRRLNMLIGVMSAGVAAALCWAVAAAAEPPKTDLMTKEAQSLVEQGKVQEAARVFQEVLKTDPNRSDVLFSLGDILMKRGDITEAETYLQRAVKVDPRHAAAWYRLAAISQAQGQDDEAVRLYHKSLANDPNLGDARADLAFLLTAQKQYEEAEGCFEEAIRRSPDFGRAHFGMGLLRKAQGRQKEALPSLEKAIAKEPENPSYRVEYAFALLAAGGTDAVARCENELLTAVKRGEKDGRTIFLTGVFYDDSGKPEQAIGYYNRAMALGYNKPKAKLYAAQNYMKLNQKDEAVKLLKELVGQLPEKDEIGSQARKLLADVQAR